LTGDAAAASAKTGKFVLHIGRVHPCEPRYVRQLRIAVGPVAARALANYDIRLGQAFLWRGIRKSENAGECQLQTVSKQHTYVSCVSFHERRALDLVSTL
jgi:hypothetical protein